MRIGIFGDSYAVEDGETWISHLKKIGHDFISFGMAGSSILYSAKLIEEHHANFEFIIWCMTTPGRFSFKSDTTGIFVHTSSVIEFMKPVYKNQPEILEKLEICKNYQTKVMNYSDEEFVGRCIADSMLNRYPNLMIIPCFPSPLYLGFSLFDITELEGHRHDLQSSHLMQHNHKRLAELINENLKPGYFKTSLDNFTP